MKVNLESLAESLDRLAEKKHLGPVERGTVATAADAVRELMKHEERPLRNCDRFKKPDQAMLAFAIATRRTTIDLDAALAFAAWLFAPASPQARHGYGTPDMAGTGVVNGG